jgi:hypothetical protein
MTYLCGWGSVGGEKNGKVQRKHSLFTVAAEMVAYRYAKAAAVSRSESD